MERVMSVEEKIRRAEEIYLKRKSLNGTQNRTQKVPVNDTKKDVKLLKKMIMQIIVCICIYIVVYTVQNSETFFSKELVNQAREVLAYDTNFIEIYESIKNAVMTFQQNLQGTIPEETDSEETIEQQTTQDTENQENTSQEQPEQEPIQATDQGAIGGAENKETEQPALSQEEQDI